MPEVRFAKINVRGLDLDAALTYMRDVLGAEVLRERSANPFREMVLVRYGGFCQVSGRVEVLGSPRTPHMTRSAMPAPHGRCPGATTECRLSVVTSCVDDSSRADCVERARRRARFRNRNSEKSEATRQYFHCSKGLNGSDNFGQTARRTVVIQSTTEGPLPSTKNVGFDQTLPPPVGLRNP
jgi:hypothetical protein